MELADVPHSKCGGVIRAGSTPAIGTRKKTCQLTSLFSVIFICGKLYCYTVIFGYKGLYIKQIYLIMIKFLFFDNILQNITKFLNFNIDIYKFILYNVINKLRRDFFVW